MTINDLTIPLDGIDQENLLDEWVWLTGDSRLPVLLTKAGDAFLQDRKSGEILFLDTVEGTLQTVANDGDSFSQNLTDTEFVMQYFAVNLVAPLLKSGPALEQKQVYGWTRPPILGGKYSPDNLEPTDASVHFSMLGQIFRQVKDLPDGTPIGDITIT